MDIDYDFADKLDLEWHSIFQKCLRYFPYQNKSETYSIEDILIELFCPNPTSEQEIKYEDKEVFEKCLIEALSLLSNRRTIPRETQIRYLLNIAKYVARDESCFINLNTENVFLSLTYLSQPSTETNTKLLYMDFLRSLLEHPSGVKWLMQTEYWIEVFASIGKYQNRDTRVSKIGCEILRILLQKAIDIDEICCEKIIKQIAGPVINTAQQLKYNIPEDSSIFEQINPNLSCLVEILEDLLKEYSANVLHYIIKFKVGHACDAIAEKCNDTKACLLVDRISIILSFFGVTEVFDGIKTIQEDPLVLSGVVTTIDREVDKGLFNVVFELFHYALKYLKIISDKWPKFYCRDREVETEIQLVALQLVPIVLEWARLDGTTDVLEETDADLLPTSHPLKLYRNLCIKTLHVCFKIKDKLPTATCSFDVYTKAVKNIIRSKDLYSKRSLGIILDCLVYGLEAPLRYLQSTNREKVTIEDAQQVYILAQLQATKIFIESFDLNWTDSGKVLDLLYILIEGASSYQWIEPIMLDCLMLLQEIISRRFSPSMALLIDTAEGLKNVGPLLYKTCFTNNWKVRRAVLEVVHTIALSANNCFSSFKAILLGASLPALISTMALNDDNFYVRATALKCLQQMFVMEDVKDMFPKVIVIDRVLDIITRHSDAELKTEAIKFISTVYINEEYLDKDITMKMYKCLKLEALSNHNSDSVQKEVVEFWRVVTRKFLTDKGWVDTLLKFPAVTFSKKIVCLTSEEVSKRCYKVLCELSRIGCLNVFEKFWRFTDNNLDSKKCLLECLHRFHYVFISHKITPEAMLHNQEILDLASIQIDSLLSPNESEDILQEIISETMMEMMPSDIEFVNHKGDFAMMDTSFLNSNVPTTSTASTSQIIKDITPSDFVHLVYRKVAELSTNGKGEALAENPTKSTEITPEAMLHNQEILDLASIQIDSLLSPNESEDILQEIISETMMEMMPSDIEFVNHKGDFAMMDTSFLNSNVPTTSTASTSQIIKDITPSDFVHLVYRKVAELSTNGKGEALAENPTKSTEVYIIDY